MPGLKMLPFGHAAYLSAKLGTARQTSAMDRLPWPGHLGPLLHASLSQPTSKSGRVPGVHHQRMRTVLCCKGKFFTDILK
ncbi:hypothetical protein E2C01_003387 [Portunus trituberculatus]|uniref:Uncharacterized protein n=1 Tax=Portunus trituberculatus TaxID=210409 RepID=A0A5B7CM83_PORTR|nr:hypothetical protein [Portunus trituberculatus]